MGSAYNITLSFFGEDMSSGARATKEWLEERVKSGKVRVRNSTLTRKTPLKRTPIRRQKFNAKPIHDTKTGETWDSTSEKGRHDELILLEKAGGISNLALHPPKVVLIEKRGKAPEISFRPDFSFIEKGRLVMEDWKPRPLTARERLIFKLWRHFGPVPLRITGKGGVVKVISGKEA